MHNLSNSAPELIHSYGTLKEMVTTKLGFEVEGTDDQQFTYF
jgi:hypothetical protein